METADFAVSDFTTPRAGDDRLAIRFFVKAKQDPDASLEAGRPVFKEHEYIQIMVPGDRHQVIMRPLSPQDKSRFAKQYEHWKSTQGDSVLTGTPLESWGVMSLAQVEEFRYYGIRTIEHLAQLRDDVMGKIPGAVSLKQRAMVFIEAAKEGAPLVKLQAELSKRDEEIASMQRIIAEQGEKLTKLMSAPPGREQLKGK